MRRKLELRQHRDHRNSARKSVQPPRERKRTEWQHPDHELRRQHLAEDGEAGDRRERRKDEVAPSAVAARQPDAQERHECDEGGTQEPGERVRGRVEEPV